MSLPTHVQKRLPRIKQGLLQGENYTTIGKACGVTERTIDRDIKEFLESGEFEIWLKQEWTRLHAKITEEAPIEAYRQLTKLISRNITRKAEINTRQEIDITERKIVVKAWQKLPEKTKNAKPVVIKQRD